MKNRKKLSRLSIAMTRRRRTLAEVLEPRVLLSGVHEQALLTAIDNALAPTVSPTSSIPSGFTAWDSQFTGSTALGKRLPLFGSSLGNFPVTGDLETALYAFETNTFTSFTALQSALAGSTISVTNAQDLPDNLVMTVQITMRSSAALGLDATFPTLFSASGSAADTAVFLEKLTMGAYWDTTSGSAQFYVQTNTDSMSATNTVTSLTVSNVQDGFIALNTTSASFNFAPVFQFDLNPVPPVDVSQPANTATLAQLQGTGFSSLVTTTVTQQAPTTLVLGVSTALVPAAHQVSFSWPDINSPAVVSSTLPTDPALANLYALSSVSPATFSLGLDELAGDLSAAATTQVTGPNPWATNLPLIGTSIDGVFASVYGSGTSTGNSNDGMQNFFAKYLTSYTDAVNGSAGAMTVPFATSDQLLSILQSIPGVGVTGVTVAGNGTQLIYSLTIRETVTTQDPLALNVGSQLNFNTSGTVNVSIAAVTTVEFGVDAATETFFAEPIGSPAFTAIATLSGTVNASATFGFLAGNVTAGSVSETAAAAVTLHDPQTDSPATPGIITSNELSSTNLATLAAETLAGSASANLPLSTTLPGVAAATLALSWLDVTQPTTFTYSTSGLSQWLVFNNLSSASVIASLNQLPTLLGHLSDSSALGKSIALIGTGLGSEVNLGPVLQSDLIALPTINTVEDLVGALATELGASNVSASATNGEIDFTIKMSQSYTGTATWSVAESLPGGAAASLQATGTLPITTTYNASIGFAETLTPTTAPADAISIVTGSTTSLSGTVSVNTPSLSGTGTIGFLGSLPVSGSAYLNSTGTASGGPSTFTLPLGDGSAGTHTNLTTLIAHPSSFFGGLTVSGSAAATVGTTDLPDNVPARVSVTWSNPASASSASLVSSNVSAADLSSAGNFNVSSFFNGITSLVNSVTSFANNPLLDTSIPFVNESIPQIVPFVTDIDKVLNQIKAASSVSTPAALDAAVLAAAQQAGFNASQVAIVKGALDNPSAKSFEYVMSFNVSNSTQLPFSLGSGLFSINGNITTAASFTATVHFGFDAADGFYVVGGTGSDSPTAVNLVGNLTGAFNRIGGNFGPIAYGIANGTAALNMSAGLTLTPGGENGDKIPASDLVSAGLGLNPTLTGSGSINLPIGFRIGSGSNAPGVTTVFTATWDPTRAQPLEFGPTNSTDPTRGFGPVNFDLGEFIADIVGPVLNEIKQYDPIPSEITDVLNYDVPILDQTIGSILGDYLDAPGLSLLLKISSVLSSVPTGGGDVDLSSYFPAGQQPVTGNPGSPTGQEPGGASNPDIKPDLVGDTFAQLQQWAKNLETSYGISLPVLDNPTQSIIQTLLGKAVTLIEFKPGDNGYVALTASVETQQVPFPIFSIGIAGVNGFFSAGISATLFANIDIGLSTRGLLGLGIDKTENLLDGFFIGDADNDADPDSDMEAYQVGLELEGHITVGGELSVGPFNLVELYGRAGPYGIVGAHVNDLSYNTNGTIQGIANYNGDGPGDKQVYLDEIAYISAHYSPRCAIMPMGSFGLQLSATAQINLPFIGSISWTYSHQFQIASFDYPCELVLTSLGSIQGSSIVMTAVNNTTSVDVSASIFDDTNGNPVSLRIIVSNESVLEYQDFPIATLEADGVDTISLVGSSGDDKFLIDPLITKQAGISYLQILTGNGNDQVDLTGLTSDDSALLGDTITTGNGNDSITGTYAPDTINIGNGNNTVFTGTGAALVNETGGTDTITGGDGNITINGGSGNDQVTLGNGNDIVHGGNGNDTISLASGADTITLGSGTDLLLIGNGPDLVTGGIGAETIAGGDGNDTINAGNGPDLIQLGQGNNIVNGGSGTETISTKDGNSTINAGSGTDSVTVGNGENVINAGVGMETITGGDGQNLVTAGAGTDTITMGNGNDKIYGDTGGSSIVAGAGQDIVYGGASNDFIQVRGGNDFINPGTGNDTVDGGNGVGRSLMAVAGNVNMVLSAGQLQMGVLGTVHFSDISSLSITGGSSGNSFDVSAWNTPVPVTISGGGGTDTVVSSDNTDFILTDTSLTRGDDTHFVLGGISAVNLTGGLEDNVFDATGWHGGGTITGGGGIDTLVATNITTATLSNTSFARGGTAGMTISGIGQATLTGVLTGGVNINAAAFTGNLSLFGEGSNNTLTGGTGSDYILGGTGSHNSLAGNGTGNNQIVGGTGSADTITGGAGQNTLVGSTGGGDVITTGSGASHVYTPGGATAVNAQSGNAVIYAYGNGDTVNIAGSTTDAVLHPGDAGTTAGDFVAPATESGIFPQLPTLSQLGLTVTLPTAGDSVGQWVQYAGSASGGGLSNAPGQAIQPAIVATGSGGTAAQIVAWADDRDNGVYQIYVARHTSTGWAELAGSAHGNGISNGTVNSSRPSITLDTSGNPIVGWTETSGATTNIFAARYLSGAWVALGSSLSAGGLSSTGSADHAQVVNTTAGPVVSWLNGATANVYVRIFNGTGWVSLGSGSDSGTGVTGSSTSVSGYSIASDGASNVSVIWTQGGTSTTSSIYLKQYTGSAWAAIGGSATGTGISGAFTATTPTVAYYNGIAYAAWSAVVNGASNIVAASSTGTLWTAMTIDEPLSAGTNQISRGAATSPVLSSGGGGLDLVWVEDRLPGTPNQAVAIYYNRLVNGAFSRQLPGDASFDGILGRNTSLSSAGSLALSVDAAGHPFVAWGDQSTGSQQVYVMGNTLSVTKVFYVDDSLTGNDFYATAAGNDSNNGSSPSTPLATIQAALALATAAGDVIVVDAGTYAGFTGSSANNGVLIIGDPSGETNISGGVVFNGTNNVAVEDLNLTAGVVFNGGTGIELKDDSGGTALQLGKGQGGTVTLNGVTNAVMQNDTDAGVTVTGINAGITLGGDTIGGNGVTVTGSITGFSVQGNSLAGIYMSAAESGTISGNDIHGGSTGIYIGAAFTGSIDHNQIHNESTGVVYSGSALLNANDIFGNTTGVTATFNSSTGGLGFVAGSVPNSIHDNTIGVSLSGSMQGQYVYNNQIGVTGTGVLGGTSLSTANVIQTNGVGVSVGGAVQFNIIDRNTAGIIAQGGNIIAHNTIEQNSVETTGASNVEIVNNSFYSSVGDDVTVDGGSTNVELLNNVMWNAGGGFDINVATNSRAGFFSDYNDLYTTGTGQIVHYLINFTDILDWQDDVNLYDLHSIGTTVVNPTWAQPEFADLAMNDLRTLPTTAGLRATSPTYATGDPEIDLALPGSYTNVLTNPSFESGVTGWTVNSGGGTQSGSPAAFDGSGYFYAGSVGTGFAQQTISLLSAGYTAAQLDAGNLDISFGGRIRSALELTPDQGQLLVSFLNGSGNSIGSADTISATNTTDRWELVGGRLHVPAGARSVVYRFQNIRETGSTDDSYLDSAFAYVLPNTVGTTIGVDGDTPASVMTPIDEKIALQTPDLYVNWTLNQPHQILWSTFGNTGGAPVKIDLYQDMNGVPTYLLTITASTADNGVYTWIPANSGLTYGTFGLRVMVSLVGNTAIHDRSTETFAIPQNSAVFYINDGSTTGDQYTTAAGNNRATGELPSTSLPMLTTLLREYSIGGSNTIYVDNGTYQDFTAIELSSNPNIGTGAGVTILGPTNAGTSAVINALGFTSPAVVDVNNATFVTLRNMSFDGANYGIWVRNGSTNFTGSNLGVSSNLLGGTRVEADSGTGLTMDHLTATGNGGDGFYAGGPIGSLTNSTSANNTGDGFDLVTAGSAVLTNDAGYGNTTGLYIYNGNYGTTATVGNSNLSAGQGNRFYNNSSDGIDAGGYVLIAGNTVYGQINGNGIDLTGGTATENIVYGNKLGILSNAPLSITYNRVFGNATVGIEGDNGATLTGNVVYSNAVGIQSTTYSNYNTGPFLTGNLVYGNSAQGIVIYGGSGATIYSNTVYQLAGDSLWLDSIGNGQQGGVNLHVDDNILWTAGAYDIVIDPLSESGLTSDFNDLYVTGTGAVGLRENNVETTLTAWTAAGGTDADGISTDPLFVNVTGADGILGFGGGIDHGTDDDFHVQSLAGSSHGGSLAPVLNQSTGLPMMNPGMPTADAKESPTIDRGDPTMAYSSEPTPNGGFVNLGAYGNTTQASISPTTYVLVLMPGGGSTALEGLPISITWRSQDMIGTVNIDLLHNGTVVSSVAAGVANNGSYAWTIPSSVAAGTGYTVRVTRNASATAIGVSASFTIGGAVTAFYVNDSTSGGTFTTAAGNDGNSGLDAAHPKATLQAILTEYNLGTGDTIYVDGGTYNLSSNIVLTAADSGITIQGLSNGATIFNRTNLNIGAYDFDFQGATGVTLENLSITGGQYGVNASQNEAATNLTVAGSWFYGSENEGVNLAGNNGPVTISNSVFHDMVGQYQLDGIVVNNDDATITGNTLYNLPAAGITVTNGDNSVISGNKAYNDGTGIVANDTATVTGNMTWNNSTGISGGNATTLSGNSSFNNTTGIYLAGGTAIGNVVYQNPTGININSGTATGNLLFNNSTVAITAGNGAVITGNVAHDNGWGITLGVYASGATGGPTVENNLLYNNVNGGISLTSGDNTPVINNTIYQTGGVAFQLLNGNNGLTAHGVVIRDNIFWNTGGPDITIDAGDEQGVTLDFNDYYTTGTGTVGSWGATSTPTLAAFESASGQDSDSFSVDPLFVNLAGHDFQLQSKAGSYHGGTLAPVLNTTTGLPQANPGVLTADSNESLLIDAGSPVDPYNDEPSPNGGYVNLGSYGDSSEASLSPTHYLTVIKPVASAVVIDGVTTPITWRDEVSNTSTGSTDTVTIKIIPTGGTTAAAYSVPDTGTYNWTPPATLAAGTYTVSISRTDGTGITATGPAFTVAGVTNVYYVNGSTAGGTYTTAAGNDSNSGLDPAHPKATLSAILSSYTLKSGDTIEMDSGTYSIASNIILAAADSGITILGVAGGTTVLNRNDLNSGGYLFDMQGATNVTLKNLYLTGASVGVNVAYGTTADGLSVINCVFMGNQYIGVNFGGQNGSLTVTGSKFGNFGNGTYGGSAGVETNAGGTLTLTGNTATDASYGFYIGSATGGTVSGNTAYGNATGITISASGAGPVNVSGNTLYDNNTNLAIGGSTLVASGNTIYEDASAASYGVGSQPTGIQISGNANASGNTIYGNYYGINSVGGQFASDVMAGNNIYNNTNDGISGSYGDQISGNTIYNNGAWGISNYEGYGATATFSGNLIYGNAAGGIYLNGAYYTVVRGNTVYQTTGDAIELDGSPSSAPNGLTLQNNILWTAGAYDEQIVDSAAYGFAADYNDLYTSGSGQVGNIAGQAFATVSAWALELGQDVHSIGTNPQFVNATGANFNVASTSPTIDAGNPASAFNLEPAANGGRVNIGCTGDTALATNSPTQLVQVLFPSGNLKLQDGHTYTITWRSAGLPAGSTATVAVSLDNGGTWTTLASGVVFDSNGNGSLVWNPAGSTASATGLIRVTATGGTSPVGISTTPFSLAPAGTAYYVSTTGNNANSGTSATGPMASIEAVLNSYHPGAGSTIYFASGTYTLFHDIAVGPADSGVTISGPSNGLAAVINRNNTNDNAFNLLDGAMNVTIENLSITGGSSGIYAPYNDSVGNNGITILNNVIYGNANNGIYTGFNFNWTISGNTIHDNGSGYGIQLSGVTGTVTNNTVYNQARTGIYFTTPNNAVVTANVVSGNAVYGSGTGISTGGVTVSNNKVHDNSTGIDGENGSVVTGNAAWRNSLVGINLSNSNGSGNVAYGNFDGFTFYSNSGNVANGNRAYTNTDFGIVATGNNGYNPLTLSDNLVYSNSIGGIVFNNAGYSRVINNTVNQPLGNAVTLNNSSYMVIDNNILSVVAGYDIAVDTASQPGIGSDYNDLYHNGANANVGTWNGSSVATLAAWQAATGGDANSTEANPKFVDPAGADAVLGYNPTANNGLGYDGGSDDNFSLSAGSPDIDSAKGLVSAGTDLLGQPRVDDPGTVNTGAAVAVAGDVGSSLFNATSGVAQGFHADERYWTVALPFAFNFYGKAYTSVNVSSNGVLDFSDENLGDSNSDANLSHSAAIAPLWEDLRTDVGTGDIYLDTSVANQVTIRWNATLYSNSADVLNFAVVLFSNGNVRFDYGSGNTGLNATVGLSAGDGVHTTFLTYDNQPTLTNVDSILATFSNKGFVDRGAYEFQGSSLDTTPPVITGTTPSVIQSSGSTKPVSTIGLTFSKPLDAIDAGAGGEYILLNTTTNTAYPVTAQYTPGSTLVTLTVTGGLLPAGTYTLTVAGGATGIHDISGNLLDGDTNGTAGGNYVRTFTVAAGTAATLSGSPSYYLKLDADGQHVDVWNNATGTGAYAQQLLLQSIGMLTAAATGGAGVFTIDNSAGNVLPVGGLVLNGDGSTLLSVVGSGNGDTLTTNNGSITYDGASITYTGTTGLLFDPHGGTDALAVNSGTLTLAAPPVGGVIVVRRFSSITIGTGAKLVAASPVSPTDRALIVTSTLNLAGASGNWTGNLDLGANDLDIQSGVLSTVTNQAAQGYNLLGGATWTGSGLGSSAAAADLSHLTALGVIRNNQGGTAIFGSGTGQSLFDGFAPGAGDVLVKYTCVGDANLDGKVDGSDYSLIDAAYHGTATGWFNGDFNYDGTVDGSDYSLIDNAFNSQGRVATSAPASISGSPSYYLKLDADGTHIDVWNSTTNTGTRSGQLLKGQVSALTITALSAGGSITIDNSAGTVLPAGGLSVVGNVTSLTVVGSSTADSLTVNTGQLVYDATPIILTGVSGLFFDPRGGTDALTVNAGVLTVVASPAGGGVLIRNFTAIAVAAGAKLKFASPVSHADRALIVTQTLTIAGSTGNWTGSLDLGSNDMDVQAGNLATITDQAAAGYNLVGGANWAGPGLSSSAAASDTSRRTALGVIQNNQSGSSLFGASQGFFDGFAPNAADILIKFTWFGDANFTGHVDGSDYSLIDDSVARKNLTGWFGGDFNFDGTVNGSDYTLLDDSFNNQT